VPDYRYELRRSDELIATGHMSSERAFVVGERVVIGGHSGIVRSTEPLPRERALRLPLQLTKTSS